MSSSSSSTPSNGSFDADNFNHGRDARDAMLYDQMETQRQRVSQLRRDYREMEEVLKQEERHLAGLEERWDAVHLERFAPTIARNVARLPRFHSDRLDLNMVNQEITMKRVGGAQSLVSMVRSG